MYEKYFLFPTFFFWLAGRNNNLCTNSFHHYSNEFSITACTRKNVTSVANLKYPRVDIQQKISVARNCRDQISATHATISPRVHKKIFKGGKSSRIVFYFFFFPSGTQNVGNQCGIFFFRGAAVGSKENNAICVGEEGGEIQAEFFVGCYTVFLRGQFFIFPPPAGNRSECLREKLIDEDM